MHILCVAYLTYLWVLHMKKYEYEKYEYEQYE
jgi:hypothetical protein